MTIAAAPIAPLKRTLLFTFALPNILQQFMHAPASSVLQGVYAKESGIGLVALGTAFLIVRIADLFSDLAIGYFSDRTAHRGAGRKAWIAAGTILSVIALWFLYRPPAPVGPVYFGFWFLMANVGWSMVEIPYRAWSLEFTSDYVQRMRVVAWIVMVGLVGNMLFFAMPSAAKALGLVPTAELNLQILGFTAIVVALLLPPLTLFTLVRVPRATAGAIEVRPGQAPRESLRTIWISVIGNHPLLRMLFAFALINFVTGLSIGTTMLYFTNYLGLGESVALILAASVPLSMIGVPFWGWLATRLPRQRMWAATLAATALCFGGMGTLTPQTGVWPAAILQTIATFFFLASVVVVPAILGDIIDYGKEKFGVDRGGVYLSVQSLVLKGIGALSSGSGLIVLGWLGFEATRSGSALTGADVTALKLVAAWIPAVGGLLAALVVWVMPISRK